MPIVGVQSRLANICRSVVIDHLIDEPAEVNGVAYIYLDYKSSELQKPATILSSLLQQLVFQMPEFPQSLGTLYDRLAPRGKYPDFEALYALILEVAKAFHSTFVVLDALDECEVQHHRAVLLSLIRRMESDRVMLFVTSRPYPEDIQNAFRKGVAQVNLLARDEDLQVYVRARIESSSRARSLIHTSKYEEQIVSELVTAAQGMYGRSLQKNEAQN